MYFSLKVRLSWGSWGWKAKNGASDVSIYRDDLPDNPIAADSKQQAPFMALLGGQYSYMARMNGNMPKSVIIFSIKSARFLSLSLVLKKSQRNR